MGAEEWEARMRALAVEDWQRSVGPGWADLVKRAYNLLKAEGVFIWDVKEKYGSLRVSFWAASEQAHDAIWALELESMKICEICGRPGKQRPSGWIKTLCRRHWWPMKVRNKKSYLKFRFQQWKKRSKT